MALALLIAWCVFLFAYGIYESRPAPEVETVLDPEPPLQCEACGIEVQGDWPLCEWCEWAEREDRR